MLMYQIVLSILVLFIALDASTVVACWYLLAARHRLMRELVVLVARLLNWFLVPHCKNCHRNFTSHDRLCSHTSRGFHDYVLRGRSVL